MTSRFYSFNKIFDADVSAKSKLVYLYLCRIADSRARCFPSRKTIAAACGLCVESVKRAVRELVENGLIRKEERFADTGRQTSNLYSITQGSGSYFYANNVVFDFDISTGAKLVLLYICRCGENRACFPAYSRIARMCAISISHALDCVRELERAGLLQKDAQYRENGGRANNLYTQPETALTDCQNSDNADLAQSSRCTLYPLKRRSSRRMAKWAEHHRVSVFAGAVKRPALNFFSCSPPHAVGVPP